MEERGVFRESYRAKKRSMRPQKSLLGRVYFLVVLKHIVSWGWGCSALFSPLQSQVAHLTKDKFLRKLLNKLA